METRASHPDAPTQPRCRLVVFSDDWGRHPSSCQHLIRHLLPHYDTLWVNTVGTRAPRLSREDLSKAWAKLRQWMQPVSQPASETVLPTNLTVLSPRMYPGFRRGWQRRHNARALVTQVNRTLGPRGAEERRIAITTLPITADIIGRLDVDGWLYYCVDDFSVWPGLDGSVMDAMERLQVPRVDKAVAVSQTLVQRLATMGIEAELLTHGIDLNHWRTTFARSRHEANLPPGWPPRRERPLLLFWGVVDPRLDLRWCRALADLGELILVGPQQSPDPALTHLPHVHLPGPVSYDALPQLAAAADVLVMPYADLPVTRAMQPLKFKEYLATGKPVVVRELPATMDWSDAADVLADEHAMIEAVKRRIAEGVPTEQQAARRRLEAESWDAKAAQLAAIIERIGQT